MYLQSFTRLSTQKTFSYSLQSKIAFFNFLILMGRENKFFVVREVISAYDFLYNLFISSVNIATVHNIYISYYSILSVRYFTRNQLSFTDFWDGENSPGLKSYRSLPNWEALVNLVLFLVERRWSLRNCITANCITVLTRH